MNVFYNNKFKEWEANEVHAYGAAEKLIEDMKKDAGLVVERGSAIYGTTTMYSDSDRLYVVPDKYKEALSTYEGHIAQAHGTDYDSRELDMEFIALSDFQERLNNFDVMAVEAMCAPYWALIHFDRSVCDIKLPKLDPWKVRQSFTAVASNSWAKAHKKLTVKKDYDLYKGQKSLFHSLRILMFAIQLCEVGYLVNYAEANPIWWEIYGHPMKWVEYKKKYKPLYNALRSKLVRLAPKPVEGHEQH